MQKYYTFLKINRKDKKMKNRSSLKAVNQFQMSSFACHFHTNPKIHLFFSNLTSGEKLIFKKGWGGDENIHLRYIGNWSASLYIIHREQIIYEGNLLEKKSITAVLLYFFLTAGVLFIWLISQNVLPQVEPQSHFGYALPEQCRQIDTAYSCTYGDMNKKLADQL